MIKSSNMNFAVYYYLLLFMVEWLNDSALAKDLSEAIYPTDQGQIGYYNLPWLKLYVWQICQISPVSYEREYD